jgi:hypothetical protein
VIAPAQITQLHAAGVVLGLTDDQLMRLDSVLALVNAPSLRERLVLVLLADGVSFSDAEITTLWRLRAVRNEAAHGGTKVTPVTNDLDLAKGLVNRMLMFRVWRSPRR